MIEKFFCEENNMETVLTGIKDIYSYMNSAYTYAKGVLDEIEGQEAWSGATRDVLYAFLDLLTQYHYAFLTDDEGPLTSAIEELETFFTNTESFYTSWEEYGQMEAINETE